MRIYQFPSSVLVLGKGILALLRVLASAHLLASPRFSLRESQLIVTENLRKMARSFALSGPSPLKHLVGRQSSSLKIPIKIQLPLAKTPQDHRALRRLHSHVLDDISSPKPYQSRRRETYFTSIVSTDPKFRKANADQRADFFSQLHFTA